METNKIDKIVRDSLQSRTIQPSSSAWERLSDQLDVVEAPRRINWFKYAGYAASVLLLISVAFFINTDDATDPIKENDIVTVPVIDSTDFVKPNFKNTVPVEIVIVKTEKPAEDKKEVKKNTQKNSVVAQKKSTKLKVPSIVKENSRIVIAEHKPIESKEAKQISNTRIKIDSDALLSAVTNTDKKIEKSTEIIIPDASKKLLNQSKIKINSDALLYAVSNPNKDINEYYKKYNIDRDEVLKNIQKELNKVNLRIEASTLLTDVEKTIDEETFKKSFMQVVKGKITGLASAFANRNN
jgi:hypothetical protein